MKERYRKVGNFIGWARDSSGYLRQCRECGRTIYLKADPDGKWRPYASWIAGDAAENEWIPHDCASAVREANAITAMPQDQRQAILSDIRKEVEKLAVLIQQLGEDGLDEEDEGDDDLPF